MDLEFRQATVANFFNKNYINVRINMDNSTVASEYKVKFDIVFLPTIIILDRFGNIKYKTDKIINGSALTSIAQICMAENVIVENDVTKISYDPVELSQKPSTQVAPTEGNILHKLGDYNSNPDILYKEAYFRIELMDGSHQAVAEKYLATQQDWSSPKNMKFILDFVYSANSPLFDYLTQNIDSFKSTLGAEAVNTSLEIIINHELESAVTRPNEEKVKFLLNLLYPNPIIAEEKTALYFMHRALQQCDMEKYKAFALPYLANKNTTPKTSSEIYANIGITCLSNEGTTFGQLHIKECIEWTKKAILIEAKNPFYYEQLALLYMQAGDKKQANKAIAKAIEFAKIHGHDTDYYLQLKRQNLN
jgi:tetratricopeptide (TPR) repeat protein